MAGAVAATVFVDLGLAGIDQGHQPGGIGIRCPVDHGVDQAVGRGRCPVGEVRGISLIQGDPVGPVLDRGAVDVAAGRDRVGVATDHQIAVGVGDQAIEVDDPIAGVHRGRAVVEDQDQSVQWRRAVATVVELDELGGIGPRRVGVEFVDDDRGGSRRWRGVFAQVGRAHGRGELVVCPGVERAAASVGAALAGFDVTFAVVVLVHLGLARVQQHGQLGVVRVTTVIDDGVEEPFDGDGQVAGEFRGVSLVESHCVGSVLYHNGAVDIAVGEKSGVDGATDHRIALGVGGDPVEVDRPVGEVVRTVVEDEDQSVERGVADTAVVELDELSHVVARSVGVDLVDDDGGGLSRQGRDRDQRDQDDDRGHGCQARAVTSHIDLLLRGSHTAPPSRRRPDIAFVGTARLFRFRDRGQWFLWRWG